MTTARTALPFTAQRIAVAAIVFEKYLCLLAESSHEYGEELAGFEGGHIERWIDMDGQFGETFVPEGDEILLITDDMIIPIPPKIPDVPVRLRMQAHLDWITRHYADLLVCHEICELDEFDKSFIAFAMEGDVDDIQIAEGEAHSLQTLELPALTRRCTADETLELPALSRDGSVDEMIWGPSLLLEPSGDSIFGDELSPCDPATVDSGDPITFDIADEIAA